MCIRDRYLISGWSIYDLILIALELKMIAPSIRSVTIVTRACRADGYVCNRERELRIRIATACHHPLLCQTSGTDKETGDDSRRCSKRGAQVRAPVLAVAIAAGLSACTLTDEAPIRDTAPALKSMQPRMVDFVTCQGRPAPAGNAFATADQYFRWHADVVAHATIVGLPDGAMTAGVPISNLHRLCRTVAPVHPALSRSTVYECVAIR